MFTQKQLLKTHQKGFSLVEVLLVMAFLSVMILPFTLLLSQTSSLSKGTYVQSTKNTFFSSAADQMDGTRQDYYTAFHDTTMDATLVESGQTLPIMNVMDVTNSDTFTKVAALYYYTNTTDPTTSPKSSMAEYKTTDVIRLNCGNVNDFLDSSNQLWFKDLPYDSSKKQPGYFVVGTATYTGTGVTVSNVSVADRPIFRRYRESSTGLDYRFDVPVGDYNVQLHFAEVSGVTDRYMNILLEGIQVNTAPYNTYAVTGGNLRANIQSYDVTVSDGVLNININRDASAGAASYPRISGIVVKKLQIEP